MKLIYTNSLSGYCHMSSSILGCCLAQLKRILMFVLIIVLVEADLYDWYFQEYNLFVYWDKLNHLGHRQVESG